ncbi:MAG: hypothetical protein AAF494_12830 [Pseudomonadota bacterium]
MFWLLFASEPIVLELEGPEAVTETRSVITSSCSESRIVQFEFSNRWIAGERGRVTSVTIDGVEVPDAAEALEKTAGNRGIEFISLRHCGSNASEFQVAGVMSLSSVESARDGKADEISFTLNSSEIDILS